MADDPFPIDGKIEIDGEVFEHIGTLKDDAFARTELVQKDGAKYLFKVSRLQLVRWPKLRFLMKRLTAREVRIHRLLEGVHGVPKLVKQVSDTSFIREFVDGRTLDRQPPFIRADFFDEFHQIVKNIHARGVAFVDLAKKENVVVTTEGRPFLIDFQVSISRGRRRLLSIPWNAVVSIMQQSDIYHVFKHKRRIMPCFLTEEELRMHARRPWFGVLHKYLFRLPYHLVKRRIIPKHGDSRYPYYEKEGTGKTEGRRQRLEIRSRKSEAGPRP